LGQSAEGVPLNIPSSEDTSAFTARPWITIDKNNVAAGDPQILNVTIAVPLNAQPGERYAAIYLCSQSDNRGSASIASGVMIPIVITVNSRLFAPKIDGEIASVTVPSVDRGKPVEILTTFNNLGNCRIINAKNKVTIKGSSGNIKWQN
jgi:hypothetical protein